jgi:uncharacterized metal-binding protein
MWMRCSRACGKRANQLAVIEVKAPLSPLLCAASATAAAETLSSTAVQQNQLLALMVDQSSATVLQLELPRCGIVQDRS